MSVATIRLRAINELLGERFYVPAYQRGYRWTERQVTDLLNDLWEFQSEAECRDKSAFYCLQPIVVSNREDGSWELVDGQQRLTTIFLMLSSLKEILALMGKKEFALSFETRPASGDFLRNIVPSRASENIDFYHIGHAYQAILNWFSARDGAHKLKFVQCLLNDDILGKNVKVIWYELPPADDPVQAFTRLNVGKIPLTNAELIRGLFLRLDNFEPATGHLERAAIAREWDGLEKVLQRDDFWYFFHNGAHTPAGRIEYLFQLIAREVVGQAASPHDPYSTFHFFQERLARQGTSAEDEWLKVKQYFMSLEEWFADRTLYHLIGFLVHDGDDVLAIRRQASSVSKAAFRRELKGRVFGRAMGRPMPADAAMDELASEIYAALELLDYDAGAQHKKRIRLFLLLFNIATLLQNRNSNLRFPFDSFKKESWDIEHVRSVASGRPNGLAERRRWIEAVHRYFAWNGESSALRDDIDAYYLEVQGQAEKREADGADAFNRLYDAVLWHFGEDDEAAADNGIGNLTLLDSATNRSYKNAVFPVKRKEVIDRDRSGTFVPLCTKNVFMKCYSNRIDKMMYWTALDREDYQRAMAGTLAAFFCDDTGSAA